ncbi:MAG: thiamine pyrophosphate-dependent enzyme [Bacillota bacterium]
MSTVLKKTRTLIDTKMHYCPGCSHGIIHRLIGEVIDELDLREQSVGMAPVGCSVLLDAYLDIDVVQAAHGRAPAVATGVKRALPENLVFTYQGDGDLVSIGMSEMVHAAARGERITIIFINNTNYGMTGGQMAPTTLEKQVTTTTPTGRDPQLAGYPIQVPELLYSLQGARYLSRVSVHDPKNINKAKKSIQKAFQVQLDGLGFSLVEVLAICPTNWRMNPVQSLKWLEENMIEAYPLGELKTVEGVS